ncbi:MAG: hypothetical protein V4735_08915 [Pseudomonadota bacterium]
MGLHSHNSIHHLVALPYPNPLGATLEEARYDLPEELTVECSTNLQYLNQYFFIRQYAYQNDLKVATFNGEEDAIDRRSHLIIVRKGHFCIGGARLTISSAWNPQKLPLERGSYNVHDYVPELAGTSYCELGRTALLPQHRDNAAVDGIFHLAVNIAKQHGCKYMVGVSPPSVARRFKKAFEALGHRYELRGDVPAPTGPENQHLKLMFQFGYLEENV